MKKGESGSIDIFFLLVYNNLMELYEHIKKFDVKYCDTDFKDELKPSALLAYLEEVACSSADELGFGYSFIKPKGYAFMLTNIRCAFAAPIPLGSHIVVKTWPTPPSYVVFGREYRILSDDGKTLLNATSRWCMVDMKSGRLLQSKVLDNQDYSSYNSSRALNVNRWKLPPFSPGEGELRFSMTVANSEYDHNMHVNNTRYADYCFNCFSIEELSRKKLKEFALGYVKQCREGDNLRFFRKQTEEGVFLVQGFNAADEIVVQSEIIFAE